MSFNLPKYNIDHYEFTITWQTGSLLSVLIKDRLDKKDEADLNQRIQLSIEASIYNHIISKLNTKNATDKVKIKLTYHEAIALYRLCQSSSIYMPDYLSRIELEKIAGEIDQKL